MPHTAYPAMLDAWSETSSRMFHSVMEANRAAFSAFGVSNAGDGDAAADTGSAGRSAGGTAGTGAPDGEPSEDRIEPAGDLDEWGVAVDAGDDLAVGDSVTFTKTISAADVERFAAASGDTNPIHLDDEWADDTRFDGRIVHGVLAAGLISAALARLPGAIVYLSQDLEFRAPVRPGDRVSAEVAVVEDLGGDRFRLRTTVSSDGELVIDGEAVVLVDEEPDPDSA